MKETSWIGLSVPLLVLLACASCAGKVAPTAAGQIDAGPPLSPYDAGLDDGGMPPADGSPAETGDGSLSSDAGTDALVGPPVDAGLDAESGQGEEGGGNDAADSGEDAMPIPISCIENSTCPSAIHLPTIYGGVNGGPNSVAYTFGDHSDWYVIEVDENTSGVITNPSIALNVYLRPPADVDFGLEVYTTTSAGAPQECSLLYGSADNGPGKIDTVTLTWPENNGTLATRLISIHVVSKVGSLCTTGERWELDVIAD